MSLWRHSRKDAILAGLSGVQLGVTVLLAWSWDDANPLGKAAGGVLLAFMMTYNIIVISHLFTHVPWFADDRLNAAASIVNSINIGQSVQMYEFSHVRNHHRFNNDRRGPDGATRDASSTYRKGFDGQHEKLWSYAFGGAVESIASRASVFASVVRGYRVGRNETWVRSLASRDPRRRAREIRQVRVERCVVSLSLVALALLSWQWLVFCYLPAFFVALTLVNVQNYYRHYGADPDDRSANSVSYYGRLYNRLTFNDGYHQEHHLRPRKHWTQLPEVRCTLQAQLDARPRIISPVPALVGFLDRQRPLLHDTPNETTG